MILLLAMVLQRGFLDFPGIYSICIIMIILLAMVLQKGFIDFPGIYMYYNDNITGNGIIERFYIFPWYILVL